MLPVEKALISPLRPPFEMIHTYSLIHDDPEMDNDTSLAGAFTLYKAFLVSHGCSLLPVMYPLTQALICCMTEQKGGVDPALMAEIIHPIARCAGPGRHGRRAGS